MREILTAGIVAFNPEINRIKANIEHVLKQVDFVIVFDNGSENADEIKGLCSLDKITYLHSEKNIGLAGALNQVFQRAHVHNSSWVITLDQDSVLPENYVKKAKRFFSLEDVGIVCSGYIEKNLEKSVRKTERNSKYSYVQRCITSGAIVRMEAYLKTAGYDETFFVDYVDFDFSRKICDAGYRILRMNDINLEHELGKSRWVRFLFWKVRYTEHAPYREYNIAKSIVIYIYRYHRTINCSKDCLSLIKHYVFAILYDAQKEEKLRALHNGFLDGIKTIKKTDE